MIKRYFKNRELLKKYFELQNDSEGNSQCSIFKAKNGYLFIIAENDFNNKSGDYRIYLSNEYVGSLKWQICNSQEQTYLLLCDINLVQHYRNIGIGSYLIKQLEYKAKSKSCEYITGDLSIVDEETERDKNLRDNFYIKNGYTISDRKIIKYL